MMRKTSPNARRKAGASRSIGFAAGLLTLILGLMPAAPVLAAQLAAVPVGTFVNPVYVAVAPGEPELLFVVERRGRIQVLRNEVPIAQPFLNIQNIVLGSPDGEAGNEQGLLSVAFPPDYAASGLFYVAYNRRDSAVVIAEFQRSSNPEHADRTTRRTLLVIPHSGARNHNGGQLQFTPDGLLHISVGDGGALDPPGHPAPDLSSLLGKILRIDPIADGDQPYTIPNSNPFVGRQGRDEIFAYGLRNPWRFSFDLDRMIIADVGQWRREEVNFLRTEDVSGVNFGWPEYEGELEFDPSLPGQDPPTFPMHVYDHGNDRCAIVGGYVVRDPDLPALSGRYIYGDACTGRIRSFIPRVGMQEARSDRYTGLTLDRLSSFGQGFDGKLYAVELSGELWRLEPPM